jgi:hypothetical protein
LSDILEKGETEMPYEKLPIGGAHSEILSWANHEFSLEASRWRSEIRGLLEQHRSFSINQRLESKASGGERNGLQRIFDSARFCRDWREKRERLSGNFHPSECLADYVRALGFRLEGVSEPRAVL